jgi:hypothetical protein
MEDPEGSDEGEGSDNEDGKASGDENPDDSTSQRVDIQLLRAKYQYTPLSDANSCIRLLELQAGQGRNVIVCKLEEIALSDASNKKYESLSYVWGSPGQPRLIQVEGMSFEVGVNLHCALKNLRLADQPRFLWVDAICIDQFSTTERNHQVPLMCEIYQNAVCTVCFLGPANNSTRDMLKMLEELAQERRTLKGNISTQHNGAMDTILPAFLNDLPVAPTKAEVSQRYMGDQTIVSMVANEWWHRIWTVQELVLSSNAVFMLSRYTIAWENFRDGVDHGLSTQIWNHVHYGFLVNPVAVPYLSMRALMGRYRRPNQLSSSAVDLLCTLIHCRHRKAKNPRDKIYAVLGLLRATHPEAMGGKGPNTLDIVLDYDLDVVYVYRKICEEIILKSGNLDVLGVCPKSDRPFLPSWVTDWSITDKIGLNLMQDSLEHDRKTHASKQTNVDARFSDDGASMTITGYELTSVTTLAETLPSPVLKSAAGANNRHPGPPTVEKPGLDVPEDTRLVGISWLIFKVLLKCVRRACSTLYNMLRHDFMAVMSVFSTLFAWERFAISQTPTNLGGTSDTVYWQTLCAGTYKNGSVEETRMLFEKWSKLLQPLRWFMKTYPKFAAKHPFIWFFLFQKATWRSYGEFWPYISCSYYRRLGSASNGWLCLLPQETEVGDLIILARGGRVPLVIRPNAKGYYTFVGEAYIHGIMDGEAFNNSRCINIELR